MATLVSPGVSVTVVDESMYNSATKGTLPLIVVATAGSKSNGSGSSVAVGTLPENANNTYLISSQRELVETFGTPIFREVGGSVVQGDQTNEYGLMAAYQFLGISGNAYIQRAEIDLDQMIPSYDEPRGIISDGAYWLDATESVYGLFEYDGSDWQAVSPMVLVSEPGMGIVEALNVDGFADPENYIGQAGDFAVILHPQKIMFSHKEGTEWVLLGDSPTQHHQMSLFAPTSRMDGVSPLQVGDTYVRLAKQGRGLDLIVREYDANTGNWLSIQVPNYPTDDSASLSGLVDMGDVYARYETDDGYHLQETVPPTGPTYEHALGYVELRRHTGRQVTTITTDPIGNVTATFQINGLPTVPFTFSSDDVDTVVSTLQASPDLNANNIMVEKTTNNRITFRKTDGLALNFNFMSGHLTMGFDDAITYVSNWEFIEKEASFDEPTGDIPEGTLWYNTDLKMEILVNQYISPNNTWVKYAWSEDEFSSAPYELQLRSGMPEKRKDNVSALIDGDIWVDSDELPYPAIHRWNGAEWVRLDNADQSSVHGVLFGHYSHDAPYNHDGAALVREMHEDTPNPEFYPEGIMMVNMDYSTYNVKEYKNGKWEWVSGNNLDGSGRFGEEATRYMVVKAMQSAISTNEAVRSDAIYFNVITAPGYYEVTDELIALNKDKKEIAFIITEPPLTLSDRSSELQNWALNELTVSDPYTAVYYPHGLTSDLEGRNVVMPASSIALRTYAYNDLVAYPWFAPAGVTRGVVSNATRVGYISDEGEFTRVRLSEGQRDVLYTNRINPIADFPGDGILVYGQKTTQGFASALDRVNVARLINHMRWHLDQLARAFLFEQNDAYTREQIKDVVERYCAGLVSARGLYDFLVVCDDSNNTPARIDRNELWLDIAIQPVKTVEFIYIPLRIRNTGESLG
jgi:hypothetical protein